MARFADVMNSSGCVAVLIAWAGAIGAAEETPPRVSDKPLTKEEARFRALDQNNDRKLSEVEFRADAALRINFVSLDADRDGFLSLSEFVSRPVPPAR